MFLDHNHFEQNFSAHKRTKNPNKQTKKTNKQTKNKI